MHELLTKPVVFCWKTAADLNLSRLEFRLTFGNETLAINPALFNHFH